MVEELLLGFFKIIFANICFLLRLKTVPKSGEALDSFWFPFNSGRPESQLGRPNLPPSSKVRLRHSLAYATAGRCAGAQAMSGVCDSFVGPFGAGGSFCHLL